MIRKLVRAAVVDGLTKNRFRREVPSPRCRPSLWPPDALGMATQVHAGVQRVSAALERVKLPIMDSESHGPCFGRAGDRISG
jgi:hypothetical protein